MRCGLLTIALIAFAPVAAAPSKKKPQIRTVTSPDAIRHAYASSVADIDCSNAMSAHARVASFEPVARAIANLGESASLPKDEFETTDAYSARARSASREWLGGADKVVVVLPVGEWKLKYDADRSTMEITSPFERDYYNGKGYGTPADFMVELFRDRGKESYYSGTNAYGASVEVTRSTSTRAAVLFQLNGAVERSAIGTAKYSIPMAPDEARAFKASAIMVLVGRPKTPFVDRAYVHDRPTFDSPSDRTVISYGLRVELQCIVIGYGTTEILRMAPQ